MALCPIASLLLSTGVIITYEVDPRRGFTHPSMISVWNGLRWMFSHTVTSSSMFTSRHPPQVPSSKVSAPSGPGTTMPNQQESSRATLVVDHSVARLYLALADNIDQSADSASPHNQRDPSSEIGLIGHHQEYSTSSYLATPGTCMHSMTNPSRLVRVPPNPTRFT